ncbi:MAG: 50S ribosomal protein L22 [Verrucomicrobiales bacterium]|nr:50S ribosomal protein L22 [Verrucomicrobiales bacterium]
MEVRAISKYVRISAMKAREVAKEIQGLPVSQALDILNYTPRKAARIVGKTLKSAIANAENNHELSADDLVVKLAVALTGPSFSRMKPMARGSAGVIRKPTAHIQIVLSDGGKVSTTVNKAKAKPAATAPRKTAPAKAADSKSAE